MENKGNSNSKSDYIYSISLIGLLFFLFGFVTWLNGTLIPYLKLACQLNKSESMLVAFAFYISYFVMALPSSYILKFIGFKKGMMLGIWVMALGTLLFIPAAHTRIYGLFLAGLFLIGTGLSILQTASNPYVTILGPIESAAKRISIMGICNKVAGVIAPLILGFFLFKDFDKLKDSLPAMDEITRIAALNELAARVILPYIVMTVFLFILGLLIRFSALPEIDTEHENEEVAALNANKTSIFQFPHLWLGVIALFFYVGVEVIAGDTIILYGQSLGIEMSIAKAFTSLTLASMIVGYFIGIFFYTQIYFSGKSINILSNCRYYFYNTGNIYNWICFCCFYSIIRTGKCISMAGNLATCTGWFRQIYQNSICIINYGYCRRCYHAIVIWKVS